MSLSSSYTATLASCVAVPQHDVFTTEINQFQLKVAYGVNKMFWKSWDNVTLKWDAPSPPAQVYLRFYETVNWQVGDVPIVTVGGYLATCATPGTFKGTSQWFWMAVLGYQPFNGANLPIQWAHIQYKGTNAGSIGLVPYPSLPPT